MRKYLRGLGAVIVFVAAVMGGTLAGAHTGSDHIVLHWPSGSDPFYRFTPEVPADMRPRVHDAAKEWRVLGGIEEPDMFWAEGEDLAPDFRSDGRCLTGFSGANGIHFEDLDFVSTNTIGVNWSCYDTTTLQIVSFQLALDSDRNWYFGTGDASDGFLNTCVPSCELDAWSVLSHEFGHAHGYTDPFGPGEHFDPDDEVCDKDSGEHTMCSGTSAGTERKRTPETHDVHTFLDGY